MNTNVSHIAGLVLQYSNTPFYIYDYERLIESIRRIKKSFPENSKIFFASMANDNAEILKIIRSNQLNLFAASAGHVNIALKCGFLPHQILFASPGMSDETTRFLEETNITILFNSVEQIRQYIKYTKSTSRKKIGIRLNVFDFNNGNNTEYFNLNNRFGILKEEIEELFGLCRENNLEINGLHLYSGTNILNYHELLSTYKNVFQFAEMIKNLEFIDLGGGFGIPYKTGQNVDFNWKSFSEELNGLVNEFDYLKGITLCFEPGRSIIAQSGYFVAKVIEVAEKHGKCFIITDASISMFPRPHIYPDANHTISLVSQNYSMEGKTIIADVCGNSIYSRDILAKEVSLTLPETGDLLVFHDAGAYCYSMRSHFLGGSFPRQFLAFNDKIVEI